MQEVIDVTQYIDTAKNLNDELEQTGLANWCSWGGGSSGNLAQGKDAWAARVC